MRRAVIALLLVGCSDPPTPGLFAIPGESTGDDFYALPFPNDLRRSDDGTIDLSEFPTNSLIVDKYRAAADELDGFGLNAPIFVRFSDDLDPASLPDPKDPATSIADDASVYLVDVDPDSPRRGEKLPVLVRAKSKGTDTIGPHYLVARPYPGFGMHDATTYALVVTNRVHDLYGESVVAGGDFGALIGGGGGSPVMVHAREVYQPLLDYLDEDGGDSRSTVVSAAVFTTQHATTVMPAIRKGIYGTPAPIAANVVVITDDANYTEYNGTYDAPNFQRGDVPYDEGGDIVVGPDDAAVVQRTEPMRFSIVIPHTPMPVAGYPIAIYQHGTGGDWRSYLDDRTGLRLAQQGIAVISTDQVLHGPRGAPGGDPELAFFNFANPLAARDNTLQGAADAFSQHRLALGLAFGDRPTVKLDPANVFFFGHSQGGLTGPGFVAFEPAVTGAVLSGAGGDLTVSLLAKSQPIDVAGIIAGFLRDDPVDADNPSIALVQMWMERADPINYAPFMVREPLGKPKNIFQTEGFTDHYTPNVGIEAFATALGADIALDPDRKDVTGVTLRGGKTIALPITNNAATGSTCVLAQFNQLPESDGHFVVFDINLAAKQAAQFLGTLARSGAATVVSP